VKPFMLSVAQHSLVDWGTPEDIGATTLSGDVRVSGRFDLGPPDGPVFGGVYAATRGAYRVVYPFHEHATLLSGELELTDEASGQTSLYGPGDSWIIAKGQAVTWTIKTDRVLKSYIAATADLEPGARP
jgi:uncharacterized cupin superfamily protein